MCPLLHNNIFNQVSLLYNTDPKSIFGIPLNLLQLIFCGYFVIILIWFGIIGNVSSIFALAKIQITNTSVLALDFVWYLRFILLWDTVVIFCNGLTQISCYSCDLGML